MQKECPIISEFIGYLVLMVKELFKETQIKNLSKIDFFERFE